MVKTKLARHVALNGSGIQHRGIAVNCGICNHVGGKSVCVCGHGGDGLPSTHLGCIGHGPCAVPGCGCMKFKWKSWTPRYKEVKKVFLIR